MNDSAQWSSGWILLTALNLELLDYEGMLLRELFQAQTEITQKVRVTVLKVRL